MERPVKRNLGTRLMIVADDIFALLIPLCDGLFSRLARRAVELRHRSEVHRTGS